MRVEEGRRVMRFALLLVIVAACRPPGYGEDPPDGPDAAEIRPDAPDGEAPDAAGPDAGPDAAPVTCEATFRLEGHADAQSVWLTGDFVAWAGTPEAGAVVMTVADGAWTVTRSFDAGSYVYKFIVDGTAWIPDPGNPETVDDGFGGVNSVYRCE